MAKPKRRKASLSSAGKVVEADLLARARELADDPSLATPRCDGACVFFSPFERARRRNLKIQAARDDLKRLSAYARSGPRLSRAYAACLIIAKEDKIPYTAQLRLPFGNVPYVVRGRAFPPELAGLQHHDDRRVRLLSVKDAVKRRRLHVYSTEDGLVCTGRRAAPPRDFAEKELEDLGLSRAGDDGRFVCPHGGTAAGAAVVLRWTSAGVTGERCAQCAGDENSLHAILEHMATPNPRREFEVEAVLPPLAGEGAPEVAASEAVARDYTAGAIGDAAFLARAGEVRRDALRQLPGPAFVLGDRWFGPRLDDFLDALQPTDVERDALKAALTGTTRTVVVDRASAVRALAEVWKDHGRDALRAAAGGDAGTADALYADDASPDDISDALKKAAARGSRARVEAALPRYRRLPAPAAVADAVARAYRADGKDAAARLAQQRATEGRARGVALAFLRALGASSGEDWKFGAVDQGMATALADDAQALLRCEPGEYHATLERLTRKAGATETLERA